MTLKEIYISNRFFYLGLTILIILVYGLSLGNGFVSDDIAEIVNKTELGSSQYIFDHISGFVRPLLYSLTLYTFGKENAFGFHLINLSFHLFSTLSLFTLIRLLYNQKIALISTLLTAIHPLLSETVVWVSGGSYTQYSFFFLTSFLLYLISQKYLPISLKNSYILSLIAYFFALTSHAVMSFVFVPILIIYELLFGSLQSNFKKLLPFVLLSGIFLLIILTSIPERQTTLQSAHYQEGGVDNPFVQLPVALSSYFQLLIFPKDLTIYHSELAFSTPEFIVRLLLVMAFLGMVIYTFFKSRIICFWLIWFLITLAPTLTPFRLNWIVAERYAYLPSIGLFVALGYLLSRIKVQGSAREILLIGFIIVITLLSVRTVARVLNWKDADTLWLSAESISPSSPNNHNNLGDLYGRRGDYERAIKEFQTAIVLKPNYADAYHNLGNTYAQIGKNQEAMDNFMKAIEFNPNLWQSYQNIASIYFTQKDYQKAAEYMEKVVQLIPNNPDVLNNLALVYLNLDRKTEAKEIFTGILRVDPNNQKAQAGIQEASK